MAVGPTNQHPQSKNSPQQNSSQSSSSKQTSPNSAKGTKPQLKTSREVSYAKQGAVKSAYTFVKDTWTGAIVALKGKSKPKSEDDSDEVLTLFVCSLKEGQK
jgi:hypothetical protein